MAFLLYAWPFVQPVVSDYVLRAYIFCHGVFYDIMFHDSTSILYGMNIISDGVFLTVQQLDSSTLL